LDGALFFHVLAYFFDLLYLIHAIFTYNQHILLDWLDSYQVTGNVAACEMIAKEGIHRYPEEEWFYSRLGDLCS
jgi:hypothetical protein